VWRKIRAVLVTLGLALVLGGFVAAFAIAMTKPADEAAAWFAAIAAAIGLIAVAVAFPAYRELRRRQREHPDMQVTIQVVPARTEAAGLFVSLAMNEQVRVPNHNCDIRVLIHNAGDGVFRWGVLNIQAPIDCVIEPRDPSPKTHYRSTTPGDSAELQPGQTVPCNFTVAERNFPPGHHFLYHVTVIPPHAGTWPIAAVLDGYPGPRAWTRAEIVTPK
jgi:hypothetical protein